MLFIVLPIKILVSMHLVYAQPFFDVRVEFFSQEGTRGDILLEINEIVGCFSLEVLL